MYNYNLLILCTSCKTILHNLLSLFNKQSDRRDMLELTHNQKQLKMILDDGSSSVKYESIDVHIKFIICKSSQGKSQFVLVPDLVNLDLQ